MTVPSRPQNTRAAAALKRAWVPGLGMAGGRKALREIAATGEGRRNKALWAMGINAVVAGTTGSIHQDPASLTPDQSAYLGAIDDYTVAEMQKPTAGSAAQDITGWQAYAAAMAAADRQERQAPRARAWPAAAAQPLATLEALDQRAAAHWQAAAHAPDPQEIDQERAAAKADPGYQEATTALRHVLGLPEAEPRSHDTSA